MGNYSGPGPISVIKEKNVTVTCISTGNPSPTFGNYSWRYGTTIISGQILALTGNDSGGIEEYSCIVETTLKPTGALAQLNSSKAIISVEILGM